MGNIWALNAASRVEVKDRRLGSEKGPQEGEPERGTSATEKGVGDAENCVEVVPCHKLVALNRRGS